MKKILLIFLVSIFFVEESESQGFYDWKIEREWIIGATGGTASYFGELNPDNEIEFSRPSALYFTVRRNIWNRIDGRAGIGAFYISANDERRTGEENLGSSFSGVNFELTAEGIIHLFNNEGRYYERRDFDPYLIVGVAATFINNRATLPSGERVRLDDLVTLIPEEDTFSPLAAAGILGLGFNYKLNYLFNIGFEGAWRYLTTDSFDSFNNRGSNSNSLTNDWYWIMGFRLETYLPPDIFKKKKSSKNGRIKFFRKFKRNAYWDN
ncbi:MAG: hypothetical protein AAF363_14355 [Bacteroidota bacterium]